MYGAILLFGVTLTLPGFAGLILTIGVAADANVVIFERIKEEMRAGKSVRAAIATGYAKGFRTIVDANVVTAITALVLFAVATAEVKGFALMLLIGTVISLVTAVAATRAMLGLLAGFRWFDNPRFMGATRGDPSAAAFLQIDFMRRRYLWFAISGVAIVVSVELARHQGPEPRHRLQGRRPDHVHDAGPDVARDRPPAGGRDRARRRGRPGPRPRRSAATTYKSFQIRLKKLDAGRADEAHERPHERLHASKLGVKNVSSSFGRQILTRRDPARSSSRCS